MLGTTLGPYRIDRELGSGGMGKVFRATTVRKSAGLEPETAVALKIVHTHLTEAEGFFKRFLREGEIGKSVRHENVVRTYDCDALGGQMFLVMEYVEGQTLRDLLTDLARVPEELCRHIGREIAKGLAAIHAAGVIHRDMKPENVLITGDHVVKVMDLGVARLNDEVLRLSQTGAFVGSIHYAAPECFSDGGKHVDVRADLHALGLVLYELASGTNPYYAESVPEVLKKVLHEEPRRVGDVNPQLSPFFEEVVHCLLAKRPEGRFADAATLLAVLAAGEDSAWWKSRAKAIRAATHQPLRRIRIPRETAVYGREADLAKLRGLYEKARAGEGRVVVVEGEAGIGKSRVVDELIGRLQRDGEEINFLFGSYPPGGAATAAGAFSTAFREQFGAAGSGVYLERTPLLVPAFDALLAGDATPSGVEPLTKESLQTCFVHALRGLGAERTTVLLVDDLHFAPDEGRALFTAIATAVPGARLLVIGTARPGCDEAWLAGLTRLEQTTHMPLQRLGAKDLVELLKDSFRSEELAQRLGLQIAIKSDGNPFFAFEIIRGLREGQFITQRDDGTWASTRVIDEIRIPSSVLDLVNARVAGLTEDERALLDVAACCGYEFDPGLVGEVLGMPRVPTLRTFGQIERRHRLVRASGRSMVFDHHQIQEALYGSLLEQLREEYHSAIADALVARANAAATAPSELDGALCVSLCEHYLKGARGKDALRYLDAAQAHLKKGHLGAQAAALTERALTTPGLLTGAARADVLLSHVAALENLGRSAAQREAIDEAVALAEAAGTLPLRARAHRALGHWFEKAHQNDAAMKELELALALAREGGIRKVELGAMGCISSVLANSGRRAEAETLLREVLEAYRECGDEMNEARTLGTLAGVVRQADRFAEAQELFERELAIWRKVGDRGAEAHAMGGVGLAMLASGRFADALRYLEGARAITRDLGNRVIEAATLGQLGGVLQALGRTTEALDCCRRELSLSRELGIRSREAGSLGNVGSMLHHCGRLQEARVHLEESIVIAREIGAQRTVAISLVNLGPVWLDLADFPRARRVLEECVDICRRIGAKYPEGYGLLGLARLAAEEGDHAGAIRLAGESLTLRRSIGHTDGVAQAYAAMADYHFNAGDFDEARKALEEAIRIFREIGDRRDLPVVVALLAALPGGDAETLRAAAAEAVQAGDAATDTIALRWRLFNATGDRAHLVAAKRRLDESLAGAPAEFHDAMRTKLRVNREVAAAAKAAGL